MTVKSYEDLKVWQKSMNLIAEIYRLVRLLPKYETYALSDQMRRSVISIASNIAEGQGRDSINEFIHFLSIARGSCYELETQIRACVVVGHLTKVDIEKASSLSKEVGKMPNALIKKLKTFN